MFPVFSRAVKGCSKGTDILLTVHSEAAYPGEPGFPVELLWELSVAIALPVELGVLDQLRQESGTLPSPGGFPSAQTNGYLVSSSGGMVPISEGGEYKHHSSSLFTARAMINGEGVLSI